MIIWLAYLNDLLVDQDEDQRDLLQRCSDKYGYDTVVRSRTFRLEKSRTRVSFVSRDENGNLIPTPGTRLAFDRKYPEPELIRPSAASLERMAKDTRPRDENGDLIDPQLPWKTAEVLTRKTRHLDGCSCRGCDHCECDCHK